MYRITKVKVLNDYNIEIKFNDGTKGIINLSSKLSKGIFKLWKNYDYFQKVKIGSSGELSWNEEIDLCPDALYLQLTGKKPEDIFPSLNKERASA